MSKAELFLNKLDASRVATRLANASEEPHLIIGDDRIINVPDALYTIVDEDELIIIASVVLFPLETDFVLPLLFIILFTVLARGPLEAPEEVELADAELELPLHHSPL